MEQLGKECKIGEKLTLTVGDRQEEFVLCGYTDRGRKLSVYPVYVSGEYADKGLPVREIPWTALVRIRDAGQMEASVFETVAYQIAADYGVRRSDVNINGRFQESLQEGNPIFQAMLLISLVILAAGGIVIYTIFYLSVTSRAQQIGQLQTIGMTEKQIRIMVRLEGFWLCAGSVPAALVLGGLIACFLEPEGWSLSGYLLTAAVTGIFGFLMVQISAGKPAAIAAKISPIEASRVVEEEDGNVRKNKKLTPFTMAQIGQGRNMKKQRLMTLSIAFGGILFMIAASYLYAWDEKAFSRTGDFADAEYVITYPYNAHSPLPYGLTGMQSGESDNRKYCHPQKRICRAGSDWHGGKTDQSHAVLGKCPAGTPGDLDHAGDRRRNGICRRQSASADCRIYGIPDSGDSGFAVCRGGDFDSSADFLC